ncbi:endonuclease [Paenibacillus frigoriresistens]|uniref:LAGLIDADG family homing endonuclease n=1 Tax=Paenibacillus alginolyticus TaxID=59839 RepID=UPI001566E7BF|nr:LAGLIDADG family homing endonuclease [Paenibacillus frigoriresistens]NRF89868.1 endonuclease [Paenibacillus frigoriresistens]
MRKNYRNKWERGEILLERMPKHKDQFTCGIITGFTMGEGSFHVIVRRSFTHKTGFAIRPEFSIKLKKSDKKILIEIKKFLGCGKVVTWDTTSELKINKIGDILEIIIPFFDKHPLRNVKKYDYELFKIVCYKILHGEGKNIEGIKKILSIREIMNCDKTPRKEINL